MAHLDDTARAFLTAGKRFAILATINADGTAQQTVMWYDIDGDEVVMNTAAGRVKDGNLKRDQRISICVEDGYNFVTIAGTARLIDDQTIAQAEMAKLTRRYHDDPKAIEENLAQFRKQRRISIRLPMEHIIVRLGE